MATTKKAKVETQIDERETFVSLQKTFADSEENVQEKLRTLYALQEADNEIEKIVLLRGELPGEVSSLEEDVAAMEAKIASLQAVVEQYANTIEANKQNMADAEADIEKYNAQLGRVENSREYDSISKEVENLELLRLIAEKNIREAQEDIEDKKTGIEDLTARLGIRKEDLEIKKKELETIVTSTSAQEEGLRSNRDALAAKVDARTLSAYNRIRESVHNHLAVVPVFNDDACGGCFTAITPQRLEDIKSGKKLIICEHCGRIIVNPDIA